MKEYKFRVWNGKTFEIDPRHSIARLCCIPNTMNLTGFGNIIQQFVGLYDKNGVEIYEGDILQRTWFRFTQGMLDGKLQTDTKVVEYDPYKGYGFVENEFPMGWMWEVKGNIFENPELLK